MVEYEEAYLSASTITDDYELPANFRHGNDDKKGLLR